jgi:hypothetical protein
VLAGHVELATNVAVWPARPSSITNKSAFGGRSKGGRFAYRRAGRLGSHI